MSILILGGGIAGLLAAYTLREHRPVVLEASARLGGNFMAGGLKYIHRTPEMEQLLRAVSVPFTYHAPQGKLHTGDAIHPHPTWLRTSPPALRRGIQFDHWIKTRGTHVGFRDDCMNDPMGDHRWSLSCDHAVLLKRLEQVCREAGVQFELGTAVQYMAAEGVTVKQGAYEGAIWRYDHLITTLPLGLMSKLVPADWKFPRPNATRLGILDLLDVNRLEGQRPPWDYMYTPRSPFISRMTATERGFQIEVPQLTDAWETQSEHEVVERLTDEANSMLAGSVLVPAADRLSIIPGHLQPLLNPPRWPDNWLPLGRFAEWEPRATADKVLARVQQFAQTLR